MSALTKAEQRLLEDYEHTIEQGMQSFISTGHALIAIRDNELYRANHKTFEHYCKQRWGMSRPRAYQLIGAVEVDETLSTIVDKSTLVGGGINEGQARELVGLPEEKVADVVSAAMETAKRRDGKVKLTAKGLREAKERVAGGDVIDVKPAKDAEYHKRKCLREIDVVMRTVDDVNLEKQNQSRHKRVFSLLDELRKEMRAW